MHSIVAIPKLSRRGSYYQNAIKQLIKYLFIGGVK